jgi:uncharacterized protein (UPF0332 family)
MVDESDIEAFWLKAEENLAAAEFDVAGHRYNTSASRCYYACFLAAVAALIEAGVRPPGGQREWGHQFVQAQFAGQLIGRRKLYPAALRDVLPRLLALRRIADYDTAPVSSVRAERALRNAQGFVATLRSEGRRR